MADAATDDVGVGRWTRRFVYGFLALVLFCGVARIEAWPLTGFRLFSSVRTDERVSWQLVAVGPDGERTIALDELPIAYRNTTTLIAGFEAMSPDERDDVCDAWVRPLEARGEDIRRVWIYRKTTTLGNDPPPPTRQRIWACGR